MKPAPRILRALSWGVAAGLAAFVLDELLAYLTLGFPIPVSFRFLAAYLLSGALVAAVFEIGFLAFRRRPCDAVLLVALTMGAIYGASVFERVHQALDAALPKPLAVTAAALALVGYVVWIAVLRLAVSEEAPAPPATALGLAVLSVAAGLAINRNLINRALEPTALGADVALLALGLALAFACRGGGRRRAISLGAAALSLALLTASIAWRPAPKRAGPVADSDPGGRTHLILVVIDTLRQDLFRAVVDETEEGRSLRAAVDRAAWFDNALAAAPWTAPSMASIMTGLFPAEHGFAITQSPDRSRPLKRMSDSVTPLAEHLRGRGYQTVGIVTNPILHRVTGIARGFDHYELLAGPTTKLPLLTMLARTPLLERDYYQAAGRVRSRLRHRVGEIVADGRPLFLWLHLMDPHTPLHRRRGLSPDPASGELAPIERLYRDETRYALRELTRMVEILKAKNLWDDAVFVLVADHGEMFASDGHEGMPPHNPKTYGHGHALYGELMRVPLVIRPPGGLPSERRLDILASHVDLHDTVVDLLGLDVPSIGRERVSLAPWLAAEPPSAEVARRTYALLGANQHGPEQRAVRTDTLKLIHFPNRELPDELYDVAADPREQRDLAEVDAAHLTELRELLDFVWSQLETAGEGREVEYDDETRERLKALGYLQ